jgi:hypothetical protein
MAAYLLVAEGFAPLDARDAAASASGLCRALTAAGHHVTVLTMAPADRAAATPGLARRLRQVKATVGQRAVELSLFEGQSGFLSAQAYVLGAEPASRAETCALLGSSAGSLVADGLLKSDVAVGWGETSVTALSALPAATRFFVLDAGVVGSSLSADEIRDIGPAAGEDSGFGQSLVARGVIGATAVIVPSPTAARLLSDHPDLALRASDEPIIATRFGCDEPPHDPASDPSLAAAYSSDSPSGKAECRRALARQTSLSVGARTLVVAIGPLREAEGGRHILKALGALADDDVAVVISGQGDRALVDQANVLAIEHAGRVAVLAREDAGSRRQILAGADALLLGVTTDMTARAAGIALRYGTIPIAPDAGAFGDFLVDYDPGSATGSALLYLQMDSFEIAAAIRRAVALRANADVWTPLTRALLEGSPRWAATAAMLDSLRPPT